VVGLGAEPIRLGQRHVSLLWWGCLGGGAGTKKRGQGGHNGHNAEARRGGAGKLSRNTSACCIGESAAATTAVPSCSALEPAPQRHTCATSGLVGAMNSTALHWALREGSLRRITSAAISVLPAPAQDSKQANFVYLPGHVLCAWACVMLGMCG
jgi:hypothetical protein